MSLIVQSSACHLIRSRDRARCVDECVIVAETHRHSRFVGVGRIHICLWRQLFGLVAIVGWLSSNVLVVAQDNRREDKDN